MKLYNSLIEKLGNEISVVDIKQFIAENLEEFEKYKGAFEREVITKNSTFKKGG